MQQQVRTIGLFGAVLAIASGLTGAYASGLFDNSEFDSSLYQTGLIMGHVTLTVADENGNIVDYRQSDNVIVNQGEDCAAMLLFGGNGTYIGSGSTGACLGDTASFNKIAIGNGSGTVNFALESDNELRTEHNMTSTGFTRAQDTTPVFTAATGVSGTGGSAGAQVVLSNEFTLSTTDVSGTSLDVTESGLFNNTSAGSDGMFAHQTFAAVTVDDTESLTVEWTINIGGTGSFASTEEG